MTNRAGADDWSDARLEAAFDARAARVPRSPDDLASQVVAGIPQGRGRAPRWAPLGMAAALGLVVVLAGLSALSPNRPGPSMPGPGASGAMLGDPLSVSAAIALRDGVEGGREIVVGGFLSPSPVFIRCLASPGPRNPTRLRCPESSQWLMERPEGLVTTTADSLSLRAPSGPSIHVSFALVDAPDVPLPSAGGTGTIPVQLVGHFHDRRAALCDDDNRAECGQTFVVDRVVAAAGELRPVHTDRRTEATPTDRDEDVDALVAAVAPRAMVVSRVLLPVSDTFALEPILADDLFVPFVDQSKLAWLVTAVDPGNGVPTPRTFMLLDGSNWFAELTVTGALLLDRVIPEPSDHPSPILSPAASSAFDGAPRTILGMRVLNLAQVVSQRKRDQATDRDEYAIAGWYVPPRPGVTCDPPLPPIHAPTPPCDAARHWLLYDPQQFGVRPGQLRSDPEEYPDVLNPIIPVDVPFEVLGGWDGDTPRPLAAIVLGHFDDTRVDAFHGNVYFVVDALAWTADSPAGPADRVVRLTAAATEDPATVVARIDEASTRDALVTWATAADARDLLVLDPWTPSVAEELTTGGSVWIVRRLVLDPTEGRPRVAVETGYTADHGTRVWLTPSPDADADLVTSMDLQDLDANTTVLRVFDYGDIVSSVAPIAPAMRLSWRDLQPIPDFIQVARGASDREVAVRWTGSSCDPEWGLEVHGTRSGPIVLQPRRYHPECDAPDVTRQVLLVFDEPVDLDRFRTGDPCCG